MQPRRGRGAKPHRTGSTLLAHFSAWRAAVSEGGSANSLNSGGGTVTPGYAKGFSATAQLASCALRRPMLGRGQRTCRQL